MAKRARVNPGMCKGSLLAIVEGNSVMGIKPRIARV